MSDAPPASTSRRIDAVIFDLGGVVMRNGRHTDLVRRFPPERAAAALRIFVGEHGTDTDHPWHRLERGEVTLAEFQVLNQSALEAIGITMPPLPVGPGDTAMKIVLEPNAAMIHLVRRLRASGLRTSILTNNVREFRDAWRFALDYDELFDDIVDSHEVGLRKPNPAIYELALARLDASAARTAFLDDLATNVAAAIEVGMFGVVVDEDASPAIAQVERLAGLQPAG